MTRFVALLALVFAAVGAAGSLYLSLNMGLKACPLCFYQRTFVLSALAVIGLSLWVEPNRAGLACLVALPLAGGGLGVAAFHESLVIREKLECPLGAFALATAPAQSLAIFAALTATCAAGALFGRRESPRQGPATTACAIALGAAFAWACVQSAPPLPPAPDKPYPSDKPIDTCRPPFVPLAGVAGEHQPLALAASLLATAENCFLASA